MTFPTDLSFIERGRGAEIEAVEGGRTGMEFSTAPDLPNALAFDEKTIAFRPVDDILEMEEREMALSEYVPYAQRAFADREIAYPFGRREYTSRLEVLPGLETVAEKCADLGRMVGIGNRTAKDFEVRAVKALHKLMGGWAVCLGSPRQEATGPERAVRKLRELIPRERGDFFRSEYPANGDLGADAIWILGRSWGGPIVYFQAKNSAFSIRDIPGEFMRPSDVLLDWFGRRIDVSRRLIMVYGVNTILSTEMKERAFQASSGNGCHIIDAVDIVHAECFGSRCLETRDLLYIA
jgi:hypothetical protein